MESTYSKRILFVCNIFCPSPWDGRYIFIFCLVLYRLFRGQDFGDAFPDPRHKHK